jgi:putative endonuclease
MYYFYILQSIKAKKLYLGQTTDLKNRIASHNNQMNKATKPYAPFELIYYSAFKNKKDCLNCEQYFKTTAGWKRIHRMLENTITNPLEDIISA